MSAIRLQIYFDYSLTIWHILYIVVQYKKTTKYGGFLGAAERIWTADLILTKDVLYLLSHSSML